MNTARKVSRRIHYEESYNPIFEYWECIKEKPLFAEIEQLQREVRDAEVKGAIADFLIKKKKQVEQLIQQKESLLANACLINTSWKVYRMYAEIVRYRRFSHKKEKAGRAADTAERKSVGKCVSDQYIMESIQDVCRNRAHAA